MPVDSIIREALALVAPPACGICAAACRGGEPACARCRRGLELAPAGVGRLAGVGPVCWAAPHRGVARGLVTALKFHGRTALAALAAERIAMGLAAELHHEAIVPVPPAAPRLRRRGFDPTALLAAAVARRLAMPLVPCLARLDATRQVGRPRATRLANPPRVIVASPPPRRALLLDDVLTTGATLAACATALRGGGEVAGAAVFAAAFCDPRGAP